MDQQEETSVTTFDQRPYDDLSKPYDDLSNVEEIIGYTFNDKSLLEEAYTDVSYGSKSYERLEYMGDSVLNMHFTKLQFLLYPNLSPGVLTRLRALNVDNEKLARVAVKYGLHRYLRHNKPLLTAKIQQFTIDVSEYPLHSSGLIDVPKVLADIVEATIGAVYLDSNSSFDTVWEVFKGLLEPTITPETMKMHPVTTLYEVCQKNNKKLKFVDLWAQDSSFQVFIDDQFIGEGRYAHKKEIAHNRAAKNALDNIGLILDL